MNLMMIRHLNSSQSHWVDTLTHTTLTNIMANKTYKVTITFNNGNPAQQVLIEANNPPQARAFAEGRYPGGTARGVNQVF